MTLSRPHASLLLFAGFLLGAGLACGTSELRIDRTCEDYCAKANECDDGVNIDECVNDCKSTIDECMADEQEQALDDLDSCAADACDEFAGCTIGAGLQCAFGL